MLCLMNGGENVNSAVKQKYEYVKKKKTVLRDVITWELLNTSRLTKVRIVQKNKSDPDSTKRETDENKRIIVCEIRK